MADVKDLMKWFDRDVRYARWGENVEVVENWTRGEGDHEEYYFSIRLYTDINSYRISACTGPQPGRTYLGCIASSRKPRAGEDWNRGNDLLDGPLTEETWHGILADIVGYELVKVHRPKEQVRCARNRYCDHASCAVTIRRTG